ncbi:MAG: response regulator transcription factor [Chitinophagaceae bacterium]|nr:response regulator transcription factor [Chitinophagaceae bacterium]
MTNTTNIKVSIIEDDQTIRESYVFLINNAKGISVVSNYATAEEALKKIANDAPDVILLDIEMPGISGLDALPKLKKILPESYILMLTVYEQANHIFRALGTGASGYLTKNTSPEKIVAAIYEVMEGGGPMSANIARLVISSFQRSDASPLTRRETEILEHIAVGKSRKRIAEELFIDLETVKSHIKNIYQKLDVHSKEDALKMAKEQKFI